MVGIAIWGLGPHAFKNVLPAIELSGHFELIGVCSRKKDRRADAVTRWGGQSWENAEEMLGAEGVDVVYVATPTGLHFSHGMDVLRAGKHLICEKSLAARPSDALELVAAARARGILLCEALAFQYHPRFREIKTTTANPAFGRVLHAFCCFGLPQLEQPGFRMDKSMGGGALFDVGCYPLCAMHALFGTPELVLRARVEPWSRDAVDLTGDASVRFANGVRVDVAWGYNRSYAADLIVVGEKQSLYANRVFTKETVEDSTIQLRDQCGDSRSLPIPRANGIVEMLNVVIIALRDQSERTRMLDHAATQAHLLESVIQCARRSS